MLFHDPPAAHVILAHDGERVVGLASHSFLWAAVGLTQSLFLKELYVAQTRRGQGVGRQLMRHLFDLAADTGCSRVEWMTEPTNTDAQAFYASIGHAPNTGKCSNG
jgi:GNAT superfamily N-acetyltransferase